MTVSDFDEVADEGEEEKVLIVDDNPVNLQVLYQTLAGAGFRILVARNGEDAIAIARKAGPRLVLLDIMMPGMDGFEVCRRLKDDPATAEAAVIFLSALGEVSEKVRGFELGAIDYITKPFHAGEVNARVGTHLKLRRLERHMERRNLALEAANKRMRDDLDAASRVQQSLLPDSMPETKRCRFAWRYRPSAELGGDGLNVFRIDDRFVAMYVLDVSGHGVPSALLAVTVSRALLPVADRSCLVTTPAGGVGYVVTRPADVVSRLNRLYPMDRRGRLYFSILYGLLDVEACSFTYVSAGNPGPVLMHEGGRAVVHDVPAVPVGLFPDSEYDDTVLDLRPGARLYLHSDGLTEERNDQGVVFGRERIMAIVESARDEALETSIDRLIDATVSWKGDANLRDDVSVLAVDLKQ